MKSMNRMNSVLAVGNNAALNFPQGKVKSPSSGHCFREVSGSVPRERSFCSFPRLRHHVQVSSFLAALSRAFQIFHDPMFSSLLSFSRLSSADTIIVNIIRVPSIPLGKPPYSCDNL